MAVKSAGIYRSSRNAKFNDQGADYWPLIWADETRVASLPASLEGMENGKLDINDSSKLVRCSDAFVHKFNQVQHPDSRLMGHPYAIGALELMIRYAAVDGVFMKMNEGYRSYSQQQQAFNSRYTDKKPSLKQWNKLCKGQYAGRKNRIDDYRKTWNGKSYWLAQADGTSLAVPGTSNHGLGLAFDLGIYVPFTSKDRNPRRGSLQPSTAQTDWLRRNAWAFGFVWEVQRNRPGFEAWHIVWAPGLPAFAHMNFSLIKEGLSFVYDTEKVQTGFTTKTTKKRK
jgi:LAS superfamily LD-carboxypeptidase LdcB